MKTVRLVVLVITMAVFGAAHANAQSKKEKIEMLTRQVDSLQRVLAKKNESLILLQVKLARIEGATDAHNEEIKRLENKSDSLTEALINRKGTIESQATKITQLNNDIAGLQAAQKDWTGKNEALNAELTSLKQKSADTAATAKDAKAGDTVKQEVKPANAIPVNKPDPLAKDQ